MFEKKIPISGPAEEELSEESLRNLSWQELRIRLAAARDLRSSLDHPQVSGQASFDANFARCLSERQHGKPDINFKALAHGKQAGRKRVSVANRAKAGNRGSE